MIVFLAPHFVVSKGVSHVASVAGVERGRGWGGREKRGGLGREVHLTLAQNAETLNGAIAYPSQNIKQARLTVG